MSATPHRIVLADDHPLILCALQDLVNAQGEFRVVAAAPDGAQALEAIRKEKPQIALIDVNMPGMGGLELLRCVTRENLPTRIVFLTAALSDEEVLEAVAADVMGIVLKQSAPETLIDWLRRVAGGGKWFPVDLVNEALMRETRRREDQRQLEEKLTAREIEIVRLAITGLPNKTIARRLNVTEGTVKLHLHNIYTKLDVSNRTELASLAHALASAGEPSRRDGA